MRSKVHNIKLNLMKDQIIEKKKAERRFRGLTQQFTQKLETLAGKKS